jgi:hypothetical protein
MFLKKREIDIIIKQEDELTRIYQEEISCSKKDMKIIKALLPVNDAVG